MSEDQDMREAKNHRFASRTIVLGVTGSIAAYKAVELVRGFIKEDAEVIVVMTDAAQKFLSPLTFSVLSKNNVVYDMWSSSSKVDHIEIAERADLLVIAPATAGTIAKCAYGICDNILTTVYLAVRAPIIFAPAMNERMLLHEATQDNIRTLKNRGNIFVDAAHGELACGRGTGRLAEISDILNACYLALAGKNKLSGRKAIVTAGPTREMIDEVRYLSNRSSGRMGFAIAEALARQGADVTLITGPVSLDTPSGIKRVDVINAHKMREAIFKDYDETDIVVMAAAVADYKPKRETAGKIKKREMDTVIELEETPDILTELGAKKTKQKLVGFALESDDIIDNAMEKLEKKNLDIIIANAVEAMESQTSRLTMLWCDGRKTELEKLPKTENAIIIADAIADLFNEAGGD